MVQLRQLLALPALGPVSSFLELLQEGRERTQPHPFCVGDLPFLETLAEAEESWRFGGICT